MTGRGRVHGSSIIFPEPLGLPEGSEVVVQIESPPAEAPGPPPREGFAALPFFGTWADRSEMADSAAWVREERERWQARAARPD